MIKRYIIITCFVLSACLAHSQTTEQDSIPPVPESTLALDLSIDTSINYDELFNEFELFLDSILGPRSYFLANLTFARGYFNFVNKTDNRLNTSKKTVISPNLGYYSKNGLGVTVTGNVVNDGKQLNLYQFAISPSYDYLKSRKIATGVAYVRYFTKDSLSFYTSPLQNEFYGYFLWRKAWLQPGITANYGWGSRTEEQYRSKEVKFGVALANTDTGRLRVTVIDTITVHSTNKESIVDFTLTGSLRHDFYWLNIFSDNDFIRFTPLLTFTAAKQKFGYNQTTGTYSSVTRATNLATLNYNTGTRSISMVEEFRPLSVSLFLRSEYSIGKFYVQPQIIFDYYFPANEDKLSAFFSFNTGFMF
ncbi:MAG TPA: hypothetical protein VIZ28_15055 [Chitinophagaceae bacterium]